MSPKSPEAWKEERTGAGEAPRASGTADEGRGPVTWKRLLAEAVTDPEELLALLEIPAASLPPGFLDNAHRAAELFPLRVPRAFVARMEKGRLDDPLLRQVLPVGEELASPADYGKDPLGEEHARAAHGVLHKYRGRALLVATGTCAVHCRYCFRRHFPYGENQLGASRFGPALDYLRGDPSIEEVILSGGDPLSLGNDALGELAARLAEIPHLRRLRLHTRTAVVLPERVDEGLVEALTGTRLRPVVVVHANHPREVDPVLGGAVEEACARLRDAEVPLLNQAVLLKGVNDSAEVLAELSTVLFEIGVLPYYLHLLDRVEGAAHFELDGREVDGLEGEEGVGEGRARQILTALHARLSGYLVPRLVREVPGAPGKVPVDLGAG